MNVVNLINRNITLTRINIPSHTHTFSYLYKRTFQSTSLAMGRKEGVSSPEELKQFVKDAGERLLVVDGKS